MSEEETNPSNFSFRIFDLYRRFIEILQLNPLWLENFKSGSPDEEVCRSIIKQVFLCCQSDDRVDSIIRYLKKNVKIIVEHAENPPSNWNDAIDYTDLYIKRIRRYLQRKHIGLKTDINFVVQQADDIARHLHKTPSEEEIERIREYLKYDLRNPKRSVIKPHICKKSKNCKKTKNKTKKLKKTLKIIEKENLAKGKKENLKIIIKNVSKDSPQIENKRKENNEVTVDVTDDDKNVTVNFYDNIEEQLSQMENATDLEKLYQIQDIRSESNSDDVHENSNDSLVNILETDNSNELQAEEEPTKTKNATVIELVQEDIELVQEDTATKLNNGDLKDSFDNILETDNSHKLLTEKLLKMENKADFKKLFELLINSEIQSGDSKDSVVDLQEIENLNESHSEITSNNEVKVKDEIIDTENSNDSHSEITSNNEVKVKDEIKVEIKDTENSNESHVDITSNNEVDIKDKIELSYFSENSEEEFIVEVKTKDNNTNEEDERILRSPYKSTPDYCLRQKRNSLNCNEDMLDCNVKRLLLSGDVFNMENEQYVTISYNSSNKIYDYVQLATLTSPKHLNSENGSNNYEISDNTVNIFENKLNAEDQNDAEIKNFNLKEKEGTKTIFESEDYSESYNHENIANYLNLANMTYAKALKLIDIVMRFCKLKNEISLEEFLILRRTRDKIHWRALKEDEN